MPDTPLIDIVRSVDGAEEALRARGLYLYRCYGYPWSWGVQDAISDSRASTIIHGLAGDIIAEGGGSIAHCRSKEWNSYSFRTSMTVYAGRWPTYTHAAVALIAAHHKESSK